jgi:hypothetical protein
MAEGILTITADPADVTTMEATSSCYCGHSATIHLTRPL